MVSSSKILTISYGTFSCTAEGFDDPLEVLKEATQFFRSVLQEDRFFGAEPPQLDPEMAEELFRRQVTARRTENGFVLSPAPVATNVADTAEMDEEPANESATSPTSVSPSNIDGSDVSEPLISDASTDISDTSYVAPFHPSQDNTPAISPFVGVATVEEKLARIRAVVSRTQTTDSVSAKSDAETSTTQTVLGDEVPTDITIDVAPADDDAQTDQDALLLENILHATADEEKENEQSNNFFLENLGETLASAHDVETDDDVLETQPMDGTSDDTLTTAAEQNDVSPSVVLEQSTDPSDVEDPFRLDETLRLDATSEDDISDLVSEFVTSASKKTKAADISRPTATIADQVKNNLRKADKLASPARALLTEQSVQDGDASRLMEQTDSQFDEPEGNRRRSAIAHLRAAVAATRADRQLSRQDRQDEQDPYREDLADAVRPRRPQSTSKRTARPAPVEKTSRPAPLTLVAEQRVTDGSEILNTSIIRPRRVERHRVKAETKSVDEGFSTYTSQVGAEDLSEILESAVSYLALVQGIPHFTRLQLMEKLSEAEIFESTREDRLRSLGRLLSEGKIERTEDGKYTMTQKTRFRPVRAAG